MPRMGMHRMTKPDTSPAALDRLRAGSPMPVPVTWHATHGACETQAAVELLHAATTRREVLHVECRSYVRPRLRPVDGGRAP